MKGTFYKIGNRKFKSDEDHNYYIEKFKDFKMTDGNVGDILEINGYHFILNGYNRLVPTFRDPENQNELHIGKDVTDFITDLEYVFQEYLVYQDYGENMGISRMDINNSDKFIKKIFKKNKNYNFILDVSDEISQIIVNDTIFIPVNLIDNKIILENENFFLG